MSKTSQKNKELKGKQKKIAESEAKKAETAAVSEVEQPKKKSGILNYGCCCSCSHFPKKLHGETQPCAIAHKYVARKAKFDCYKCKVD